MNAAASALARIAAGLLVATSLPAQVPGHATHLHPSFAFVFRPSFLQLGDVVHAFAYGGPGGVMHARSLDGGRTWPLREQAVGPFVCQIGSSDETLVVPVATRPGELLVLADDVTFGPRLVRSFDAGTTWSSPTSVAAVVTAQSARRYANLYVDGPTVVAVWGNDRPTGRVWTNRSTDGGATWQPTDTRLDLGVTLPTSVPVRRIDVFGIGPTVHVVWNQGFAYYQRSLDGGATWLPAAMPFPAPGGGIFSYMVDTAADGNVLFVVDETGKLGRSADAGTSWQLVAVPGVPRVLEVAIAGARVVATGWNGITGPPPVFLVTTSADGGVTWQATPLSLPSPTPLVFPHAIATSSALFVHLELPGYPGNALRSTDGGASWQVLEGPVTGGFHAGERRTIHATSTPAGFFPQYHAYVGVGSTILGSATTGTGGGAPVLSTAGLPVRGGSTTMIVGGALGGTLGALAFSFAPPVAVPLGGGTVHLGTLDLVLPFVTSGAPGQPGAGTFGLPVSVPANAALVGASLVVQAWLLDGGAPPGFTLTNAIELWLR
ncbi:MAG: sialidase family protein [Planctomycetota bacterium]